MTRHLKVRYQIDTIKKLGTKLIQDWKVRNQIDTIKRLGTKLKYGVNDKD